MSLGGFKVETTLQGIQNPWRVETKKYQLSKGFQTLGEYP
jgi:hypothetical protein